MLKWYITVLFTWRDFAFISQKWADFYIYLSTNLPKITYTWWAFSLEHIRVYHCKYVDSIKLPNNEEPINKLIRWWYLKVLLVRIWFIKYLNMSSRDTCRKYQNTSWLVHEGVPASTHICTPAIELDLHNAVRSRDLLLSDICKGRSPGITYSHQNVRD